MQLGKAFVGALIGSAIGAGALIGAYFLFGVDQAWLAILVAVLAGLGVHALVATKGHASYLRGAMTCALAISAFVGSKFLIAELATRQAAANVTRGVPVARASEDEAAGESAPAADADSALALDLEDRGRISAPHSNLQPARGFSPWDYLWICVAALVAYELGRGSGPAAPSAAGDSAPGPEPPQA